MFNHLLHKHFLYDESAAGGGGTEDKGNGGAGTTPEFEEWLKTQPENIQKLYGDHTANLKSALEKERKANSEAAPKIKRLTELEQKEKERADAELSAAQKAEKALEEQKTLTQSLQEENRQLKLRTDFNEKAKELKLEFVNKDAADDAFSKLDKQIVGEDMKGMEAAVKQLAEKYSYYFGTAAVEHTDATQKGRINPVIASETLVAAKKRQGAYSSV